MNYKEVTPQIPEEQHEIFLVKKRVVDISVERIQIDKERNLQVEIRLHLPQIIGKDSQNEVTPAVQIHEGETCTRRPDLCPAAQVLVEL